MNKHFIHDFVVSPVPSHGNRPNGDALAFVVLFLLDSLLLWLLLIWPLEERIRLNTNKKGKPMNAYGSHASTTVALPSSSPLQSLHAAVLLR